jgi:hypothetical protein
MSPSKKRQTMGKITRERELKEKRALKLEKREEKRLAGREAANDAPVEGDGAPEAEAGDEPAA